MSQGNLLTTNLIRKSKPIVTTAITILCVYSLFCVLLYLVQETMIFFPRSTAQDKDLGFTIPYEEIFIETEDEATIHGVLFKADNPKGVFLHFHGNAEIVHDMESTAQRFVEMGYSFLATDYRSFGKSTGSLSEANMFNDAALFYDHLVKSGWKETDIIISGRSFGTGVAVELASRKPAGALILLSPFYTLASRASESIPFVPVSLILRYPMNSAGYLEKVACPVLMLHGDRDNIIPLHHSQKLAEIKGELYIVKGGGHNDLTYFESLWRTLESFLNNQHTSL